MDIHASAPWHRASFDRFLHEQLPQLLAERLPLAGYRVEAEGPYSCRIRIVLGGPEGDVGVEYREVPQPDEEGFFRLEDRLLVVRPVACGEDLATAEIRCAGEQAYEGIDHCLVAAPEHVAWDEKTLRTWLPLDTLIRDVVRERGVRYLAPEDHLQDPAPDGERNWLDRRSHLRRIERRDPSPIWGSGYWGRVCPVEAPEGPNIGRILHVAAGAAIRDGRLLRTDERPEAALGLTASMVPFLEHNDASRQLMGVNMMRQWLTPPDPEPALVQTGHEPAVPGFWCGRNLLTAFINWGPDTFEDGAVISESCAGRLGYPYPVEPGDKLSNRHGIKAVVNRILPDGQMPHLPDGTPVEIIWDFMGLPSRMGLVGALREVVMGRLARLQGAPAIVPPFHAPSEHQLREQLREAGLREDGMEQLTLGKDGPPLARASTAGWVYWGRLHHVSRDKLRTHVGGPGEAQGEIEYVALRDAGALENLREQFHTRAAGTAGAETLAARAAAGEIEPAGPPSPRFAALSRTLAAGGVRAELTDAALRFRFEAPEEPALDLAHPVPHPWLREQSLSRVGICEPLPQYLPLWMANSRVEKMIRHGYPESLMARPLATLEVRLREYLDALLTPEHLRFAAGVLFSGRAVAACGADLRLDQAGLPDEIAWTLFGPWVQRELGEAEPVRSRDARAAETLDRVMARSWVLVNRPAPPSDTPFLAFHPVRTGDRTIRIHPLACSPMNADFDGDQVSVFLPLTAAAQQEAGERLSVAGQIRRDPGLLRAFQAMHAAKYGLAELSRTPEGRAEIAAIPGAEVAAPHGFLTKDTLADALDTVLARDGVEAALDRLDALMRLGFRVARESGASMGPFFGAALQGSEEPPVDDPEAWAAYAEDVAARLAAWDDFGDDGMGPILLAMRSGARANLRQLARIVGPWPSRFRRNGAAETVTIQRGYRDGLTPEELRGIVRNHWEGLDRANQEWLRFEEKLGASRLTHGLGVLARARQWQRPGIVFARAAASGEIDPLTDPDTRLFVGLPPES